MSLSLQRACWNDLAVSSIRRLWSKRSDPFARKSLRGWIDTARQLKGR